MKLQLQNDRVKFIDPGDLLIESIVPEMKQFQSQVLDSEKYDGYDLNYNKESKDDEIMQNNFHVGAGVYFDIDKNEEDDCEEEERKKKLWFLPFSVDSKHQNQTLKVDSNLVISQTPESGGLFSYEPVVGDLPGVPFEEQEEEEDVAKKVPPSVLEKSHNKTSFQQFDDDYDDKNANSGASMKKGAFHLLLICGLVFNICQLH